MLCVSQNTSGTHVSSAPEAVRSTENTGGRKLVVVAGKFDAFHSGHRELARVAAEIGSPVLLSFSGMARALGWRPRAPVVAPVERSKVLRDWSAQVGAPVSYKLLPFDQVQHLSPEDFLTMIRRDLKAVGIVCGADWRFGHRAAGDVDLLRTLTAPMADFSVRVVDPVYIDAEDSEAGDRKADNSDADNGTPKRIIASSSAVRDALARGKVELASRIMDRPHRLVGFLYEVGADSVVCNDFVNQVPGDGTYECVVRVLGQSQPVRSFVSIRRPHASDPLLPAALVQEAGNAIEVRIYDVASVYCEDCEVYIDFLRRVT